MRWSELRSRVEAEFAEDIRGRVSVHITRHHDRSRCGRAWITIDGEEIANFCDWSVYYTNPNHRASYKDALAAYGELRAWDFKEACWALVHEGIGPALASGDPLRQSLAVLHRKFGRRRLDALLAESDTLHPLVRFLAEFRRNAARAGARTPVDAGLQAALALGDSAAFQSALATAVRARGVAWVANEAGLGRESLYKALRPEATPQFWTVIRILRALGASIDIVPHARASAGDAES